MTLRHAGLWAALAVSLLWAGGSLAGEGAILRAPSESWGLSLETAQFEFEEPIRGESGSGLLLLAGEGLVSGWSLEASLIPAPTVGSAEECVERYVSGTLGRTIPRGAEDIHRRIHGGRMPLVEYRLRRFGHLPVNQLHVQGFLYRDGTCAAVHLAKTDYNRKDRPFLDRTLDAVKLVDLPAAPLRDPDAASPGTDKSKTPGSGAPSQSTPALSWLCNPTHGCRR